ncbi:MAG: F-type H+-transporting ATPase subunit epsilon [Cyclobacteriaceae bacterium]|jgi:F-type H+-transporting ATPase subunit epsilon
MFIEVVTPDEKIYTGEVESATFPGSDGSFQVLNNHAPMISTLGKGDMKLVKLVDKKTEEVTYDIEGGVVEVLNNKVTVLAERINKG